jgi:hypothetical protein
MSPSCRRTVVSVSAVLAAFLAGATFDAAVGHREARAQSIATSSIVVPEGGLVFRATDGTPIARLSRDAHGGTFELFDERGDGRRGRVSGELRPNPYVADEADPWANRPGRSDKPGPGF